VRRYLTRRLIQLVPLLLIISFMTFGLMHLAPGGPEQIYLAGEDPSIKAEDIYALREKWGLNDPFPVQYARWLGNVLKGDLGTSYRTKRPVLEEWKSRLPASIQLNVVVLVLIYGLAIPLGVVSAVRQYSRLDYAASTFSFLGFAMPNFWVGLMLIVLVALPSGGLIPTSGFVTYGVTAETHGYMAFLLDKARYMLLPVITLVTGGMAAITRYVRNSMLEVLKEDYVRTARAKGINERVVIYKHAMRNALLPVITISGGIIGSLFGGSIVIEQVFAWPGVGQYALAAINTKDHPVVLALLLFGALVGTLSSFVTEIVYVSVDPRIKYS
jgi:peptide/nickel transport system permease protein